ncbi:MAG: DUF951 domain-containing protein [Armatimonadota bacterium]|nr:DUF951 domain-containing protein [Armatimonadota bacterium]MDR7469455.1 DUF951 domain-containing protein [Armatimonadota bacterium]MDR7473839.1 DUF951 domain-containing protein [Armatimonadota bacterium]MDR7539102.1 DUF951 domain-containing protein [Armatimonadota bacterium]
MAIVKLNVGDVVRTRKAHPCGSDQWEIVRLGADVRIRCMGCGRSVLMPRVKLERRIRQFVRRAASIDSSSGPRGDLTGP